MPNVKLAAHTTQRTIRV